MRKRVMALLFGLVLLAAAIIPVTAMAAEGEGGSFVFVATQVRPIFPVLAGISGSYNTIFIVDLLLSCLPLSAFHDHSELMSAIRIFSRNIRCRHIKSRPDHLHDQAGELYFT